MEAGADLYQDQEAEESDEEGESEEEQGDEGDDEESDEEEEDQGENACDQASRLRALGLTTMAESYDADCAAMAHAVQALPSEEPPCASRRWPRARRRGAGLRWQ